MKNKEQIQKLVLLLLIVFAILYSYANYVFFPQVNHILELRRQVIQSQALLQQLTYFNKNSGMLEQQILSAQEQVKKGSEQVPAQLDKPQLAVDVYDMAKLHGVSSETFRFDKIQSQGTYQMMGMNFVGSGQASNILGFVQDLQTSKDLLAVQGITLTANQGSMHVEVAIMAYATSGVVITPAEKPPYMNFPFGINSLLQLFGSSNTSQTPQPLTMRP